MKVYTHEVDQKEVILDMNIWLVGHRFFPSELFLSRPEVLNVLWPLCSNVTVNSE